MQSFQCCCKSRKLLAAFQLDGAAGDDTDCFLCFSSHKFDLKTNGDVWTCEILGYDDGEQKAIPSIPWMSLVTYMS